MEAPPRAASGSDVILTTSFSSALLPAGTISVGTLGRVTMSAFMRSAASRSCSSSVFDSSFKSVTRPLAASASSRRPAAKSFSYLFGEGVLFGKAAVQPLLERTAQVVLRYDFFNHRGRIDSL